MAEKASEMRNKPFKIGIQSPLYLRGRGP
jgi:hypothetical protein